MSAITSFYKAVTKVLGYLDACEEKHFSGPTLAYAKSSQKATDTVASCGQLAIAASIILFVLGVFTVSELNQRLPGILPSEVLAAAIVLPAVVLVIAGVYLMTLAGLAEE